MSVETTSDESTDFKAGGRTTFHRDAERALDALPDRFQEHSSLYESDHSNNNLIVVPSHPAIDDGETMAHLMFSHEEDEILKRGFSRDMVTHTNKGVGVKFWYEYESSEEDE